MTKFKFPTFNPETVQERFKEIGKGKVKETKDDRLYVLTKDKEDLILLTKSGFLET